MGFVFHDRQSRMTFRPSGISATDAITISVMVIL